MFPPFHKIKSWQFIRVSSILKPKIIDVNSDVFKKLNRAFCASASMVKILNVAEKNNVAKGVAQLLSKGQLRTRNGNSVYNKIYEFPFTFMGRQCTMVFTSVSGHLLHLDFANQFTNWRSCDPVDLFGAPVYKNCLKNYMPIKTTLEAEVRGASALVIWTDCDREGENIGFEIIEVCSKVKANLDIYRAKFSEVTQRSVVAAVQNLQRPNKRMSDAVDVRIELDLRIGASFTRFQTLRFQRIFPTKLADQLVSYGSCQFPTLGFVVERYKQIKDFITEPFWKLRVLYKTEEGEDSFNWERGRLFDRNVCLIFHQICLKKPTATVTDVKSKPKSKWRPLPLETVELEKLASRKLKISAQETMTIAERLYTNGFISYPRTETNVFPKNLDLRPMVEMQTANAQWGDFASRVLNDGPNPRKGTKTDEAHPPIHPTKYTDTLNGNDKRVYEFIVRHFLACLSKDAEGFETTVTINVAEEKFTATGLMITAKNYLEVYPYDKWSDKNILIYSLGQTFQPTEIQMLDGETSPPPLLTEADLIALMEKHGIGTDATHAEHIETVKKRHYVVVQEGKFLPGKLGMGLVEGYDSMGFEMSKPKLRAALEADLKRICDGQADPKTVLRDQIEIYRNLFIRASEQVNRMDEAVGKYLAEAAQQDDEPAQRPPIAVVPLPPRPDDRTRPVELPPANVQPQNSDTVVNCNCGVEAKLLTVRKVGPNTGKQFYGCSKPQTEQCGFFQWADGNNPTVQQRPPQNDWRHNNHNGGGDDGSKKKRKCGECREEGHTKRTCPSKKN